MDGATSSPYRAVIADDEPAARDVVRTFLAGSERIAVVGEAANGREAIEQVRRLAPALLFLDIQMPDVDGFRVLEALDGAVPRGIVFVTAHDEHALRAFEVHALDYVLKPFGRGRFDAAVARAIHRLEADDAVVMQRTLSAMLQGRKAELVALLASVAGAEGGAHPERIAVRHNDRTILLPVDDIEWLEADRDYVRVHVAGRSYLMAERMHVLEARLDPRRFLRIHRSTIVNTRFLRELARAEDGGGAVVLASGVQLRVARNRWSTLERVLELRR
jgi:two-component system, LytTR family, response regulator